MCVLEDKSDLENSVMQKKIKIPKLSLNHIEEDGEAKDYGEEDLQLRHIKVTTSFLSLDVCGSYFRILDTKDFSLASFLIHKSPGVTGCGFFGVEEAWENECQFAVPASFPRSPTSCPAIQHGALCTGRAAASPWDLKPSFSMAPSSGDATAKPQKLETAVLGQQFRSPKS